jgi:nucleotide-binding universal stress UspA family protein
MNIMICYDGTKPAKAAIDAGIQMCRAFNAKAHIVISVIVDGSEKYEFTDDDFSKEHKIIDGAKKVLNQASDLMEKAQIFWKTHLLNRGLTPGEDFVSFAKEINADFIIIGIRQRSKLGKLLTGSTAQYAILKALCPVLTIPPKAQTDTKERLL